MTSKTILGATRAMFFSTTSPHPMMRGPQVAYAIDDGEGGGGDDTSDEFREQPGDREPEPDAGGVDEDVGDGDTADGSEDEDASGDEEDDRTGDEDGAGGEDDESDPEPEPEPRKTDWRDKQIAKARQTAKTEKEAREDAEARLAAAEALLAASPAERAGVQADQIREVAKREALDQVRQEEYIKRLNNGLQKLDADGSAAFPKTWGGRVDQAREALQEELLARPDFLEEMVDLFNGAAVYHELTGDIDKLEELLAMPPAKMGRELERLSLKLAAPAPKPRASRAPAPIKPLDKHTMEDLPLDDPNISQAEFNRRMDAEEEKRAKAARR